MPIATITLPTNKRSLFNDLELERAVLAEKTSLLAKVPAKHREKAEERMDAAIVKRNASGVSGTFGEWVAIYRDDMREAAGAKPSDDSEE